MSYYNICEYAYNSINSLWALSHFIIHYKWWEIIDCISLLRVRSAFGYTLSKCLSILYMFTLDFLPIIFRKNSSSFIKLGTSHSRTFSFLVSVCFPPLSFCSFSTSPATSICTQSYFFPNPFYTAWFCQYCDSMRLRTKYSVINKQPWVTNVKK